MKSSAAEWMKYLDEEYGEGRKVAEFRFLQQALHCFIGDIISDARATQKEEGELTEEMEQ